MTDVHPIATGGYGRSADSYVRGRPDYPPAALDWLRSDLGLGPGQTALELGSGTGKFTRLLVEKLLLQPTERLKNAGDAHLTSQYVAAINRLFDLAEREPPER